jgi:hypothetical protein
VGRRLISNEKSNKVRMRHVARHYSESLPRSFSQEGRRRILVAQGNTCEGSSYMLGTSIRQRLGSPVSGEDCCCRGKYGISYRLSCRKCGLVRYHVGWSISYRDGSRKEVEPRSYVLCTHVCVYARAFVQRTCTRMYIWILIYMSE